MDGWKLRLKHEGEELQDRIERLEEFQESDEWNKLDESERGLLVIQLAAMTTYLSVLAVRMLKHGLAS